MRTESVLRGDIAQKAMQDCVACDGQLVSQLLNIKKGDHNRSPSLVTGTLGMVRPLYFVPYTTSSLPKPKASPVILAI